MTDTAKQLSIFRVRKFRAFKQCQKLANFHRHNNVKLIIEKNNKLLFTKIFTFSRQLAVNKPPAPLTITKALHVVIASCELLAQSKHANIKISLIVVEHGIETINETFTKIDKPIQQVSFDISPLADLIVPPLQPTVQPTVQPSTQPEPVTDGQFSPIYKFLIHKLQSLPTWFQSEPADQNGSPLITISTIDDVIYAQQSEDGLKIVHLLLNNLFVYDQLPKSVFINEFNSIVRNYYNKKFGVVPRNYKCLIPRKREIRFLTSKRRPAFYRNILKDVPKPENPNDPEDVEKIKFHLEYAAKNDPANSNSVKKAATHLGIKYWRALKLIKKAGLKKFKIHTAPALQPSHKTRRIKFAIDVLNENKRTENDEYLRKIWYSDECHVALRCPNLKNLWHWGSERPDCLEITQSAANYVSVWAAVNADHKTELYFLEKPKVGVKGPLYHKGVNGTRGLPKMENVTVNSKFYVEDILSRFREDLDRLGFIKDNKLFEAIYMQDG